MFLAFCNYLKQNTHPVVIFRQNLPPMKLIIEAGLLCYWSIKWDAETIKYERYQMLSVSLMTQCWSWFSPFKVKFPALWLLSWLWQFQCTRVEQGPNILVQFCQRIGKSVAQACRMLKGVCSKEHCLSYTQVKCGSGNSRMVVTDCGLAQKWETEHWTQKSSTGCAHGCT